MTDWIMAIFALLAAIGSVAAIAVFVPDLDLIIVTAIVSAMAIWDFWTLLRGKADAK